MSGIIIESNFTACQTSASERSFAGDPASLYNLTQILCLSELVPLWWEDGAHT